MDPPTLNDVDEALNEEQLINIQIDAHSVKEVLSELSVRLETAYQQISVIQDKKEINDINEKIDKLQEQIESVASQSSRRINNAPQSMEEVTQEIKKHVLPLREKIQKMLNDLHDTITEENTKFVEDKFDHFQNEINEFFKKEYASISQHNSLLAHIQTIYDKISDLSRQKSESQNITKEIVIEAQNNESTIPNELLDQLKLSFEKIENLETKATQSEKYQTNLQNEILELKEKIEEQDKIIKENNNTIFLLGQKFNQFQNELEGRLNVIELSNLNEKQSPTNENDKNEEGESNQPNIMSKIIPIISKFQEKQYQLESKVEEQSNLIKSLQANQNKHHSKPTVTFAITETNSHQVIQSTESETSLTKFSSSTLSELNSHPIENELIETQKTSSQTRSLQNTPRDHQSFKELSRHINENDLRVSDLENEIILIKALIKDSQSNNENNQLVPNPETVAELKLAFDQKRAEQTQLVLSALSSSPQSKHQTARTFNEEPNGITNTQEPNLNDQNTLKNSNILTNGNSIINDITINDFGKLSKQVQSLLLKVDDLENRVSAQNISLNKISSDSNPTTKSNSSSISPTESISQTNTQSGSTTELSKDRQKRVKFSSASVQTYEDTEIQVVITSDTATSPSTKRPEQTEAETQTQSRIQNDQQEENYRSILNNENHLESNENSSKIESEPESNENRTKKVELRITTPINEDIPAARVPNEPNPTNDSGDKLNPHYTNIINNMKNTLSETIQKVATLNETMKYLDHKIESLSSSFDQLKSEFENYTKQASSKEEEFTTNIIKQVRFEVDQRLMGLTPQVVQDLNNYASLGVVKMIAQNFQSSVDGIEQQIGQIKDFLNSLVTRNDLDAVLEKINSNHNNVLSVNGDTAGGTFKMRCLLCGREASGVTGMITESEVAKLLGTPPNGLVGAKKNFNRNSFDNNNNSKLVLSYGKDAFKPKNKSKIKVATLPPMEEQKPSSNTANIA